METRPLNRLAIKVLLSLSAVLMGTSQAHAMHPADFPHQHIEQPVEAPREPQEAEVPERPQPWERARYYGGVGGLGGAVLPNESLLAEGLGEGGGFELLVGWRLNRWVALDFAWATSFHATRGDEGFKVASAMLSTFTGWARVYIANRGRFEPYVAAGLSLVTANGGPQSSVSLMGVGGSTALGLDIHLNEWLSLGLRASYLVTFLDNQVGRLDHLPDYPAEAAFIHMVGGATHLRVNF